MTVTITENSDEAIVIVSEETFEPTPVCVVVEFTRDVSLASGSQQITGVGFKPRAILFTAGLIGGSNYSSFAQADENTQGGFYFNLSAATALVDAVALVGTTSPNYQTATLTSLDADGFTLDWVKSGTPTGTASLKAMCFR